MTDDLRELAEAAIEEAAAYRRGEGSDPDAIARFYAAASPDVVLDLLNRLDNWEQGTASACAKAMIKTADDMRKERDQWKQAAEETELAYREMYRECLDARDAVRRLAGALVNMMDDGDRTDRDVAEDVLADPVVRRIVEGG